MFQLLVKIYELIAEQHNWLFEWKDNGFVEDKEKWMQVFLSSFDSEFNFNKICDTMPKFSSITNEEPVHDDLK